METPSSLLDAIRRYPDPETCLRDVAEMRWPNGPVCPRCEAFGELIVFMPTRGMWRCRRVRNSSGQHRDHFRRQSNRLDKWLTGMWLVNNCKNGLLLRTRQRYRSTQRTAWFMLHRLRFLRSSSSPRIKAIQTVSAILGRNASRRSIRDTA